MIDMSYHPTAENKYPYMSQMLTIKLHKVFLKGKNYLSRRVTMQYKILLTVLFNSSLKLNIMIVIGLLLPKRKKTDLHFYAWI